MASAGNAAVPQTHHPEDGEARHFSRPLGNMLRATPLNSDNAPTEVLRDSSRLIHAADVRFDQPIQALGPSSVLGRLPSRARAGISRCPARSTSRPGSPRRRPGAAPGGARVRFFPVAGSISGSMALCLTIFFNSESCGSSHDSSSSLRLSLFHAREVSEGNFEGDLFAHAENFQCRPDQIHSGMEDRAVLNYWSIQAESSC